MRRGLSFNSSFIIPHSSFPFEDGLAFFEEGARALANVFGGEEAAEEFGSEFERVVEGEARAARDGIEAGADGERRCRLCNRACERFRLINQTCGFYDAVDEAEAQRFVRIDFVAREHRGERAPAADGASEPRSAAVCGDDSEPRFRQTEARIRGGHAQVAREREFAPAARRRSRDSRDDGRATQLYRVKDLLPALGLAARALFVKPFKLSDVSARAEVRAAQDDSAQVSTR